ncbi:MAG: hypothetical protein ACRENG_08250 [bacterium]
MSTKFIQLQVKVLLKKAETFEWYPDLLNYPDDSANPDTKSFFLFGSGFCHSHQSFSSMHAFARVLTAFAQYRRSQLAGVSSKDKI